MSTPVNQRTAARAGADDATTRLPAPQRRAMIVEAARAVIVERGIANTRMRDLAAVAEVSLGTLTYHFSGIEEILAEAVRAEMTEFYDPIVERSEAAATGREALRVLVDGFLSDDLRTREHWLLWLDFWTITSHAATTDDASHAAWQSEVYDRWREVVSAAVRRGQVDGSLAADDVAFASTQFMVLLDGVAAQAFLPGREIAGATPHQLMWSMVERLFGLTLHGSGARR